MNDTVTIAVIGNTSAGKTSFLRTLMRDLSFGEVGVDATTNSKKETGDSNVIFVDTPGFQGAELIREWVEEDIEKLERPSPEKIIQIIAKHQDRTNRQLQEGIIKHDKIAWQALKDADAILYLVDIRQHPNSEGNLESSYTLLPDNQVQIIFNFLPQDKTKLKKQHDEWDELKYRWGNKGTFIDYDAFHRDYESEIKILRGIRSKLIDSSKVDLMDRYIQKRIEEEKKRVLMSICMLFSLMEEISSIHFYAENIPKRATDKENINVFYERFKNPLYDAVNEKILAFCKSILYIWGFQTSEKADSYDKSNNDLLPGIRKRNPGMFAMSKLVQCNYSEIPRIFSPDIVKKCVYWDTHFTSLFPWVSDKRMCGGVSLNRISCYSFLPGGLDFIKKVQERGIATPSSLYHLNREDEPCKNENKIKFIMPTEPEFANIDKDYKDILFMNQDPNNPFAFFIALFKCFNIEIDENDSLLIQSFEPGSLFYYC